MLGISAAAFVSPLAQSKDMDEGDPLYNVRVASAMSTQSHKAPKELLQLKEELTSNKIKSELSMLDRSPDLNRRVLTVRYLTVHPEDAVRARRIVNWAMQHGVKVKSISASDYGS